MSSMEVNQPQVITPSLDSDSSNEQEKLENSSSLASTATYITPNVVKRAKTNPTALTPANILALQRTIGNKAVSRLLSGKQQYLQSLGARGIERMMGAPAAGPIVAPPPTPTLSAANVVASELEGPCGYFQRVKTWQIANPVQGIIVQHVTRTFNVKKTRDNARLAGGALNAYVTDPRSSVNATEIEYWELWTVDAAGNVSDGGNDTFSLCSLKPRGRVNKNTTRGTFTMIGEARFYPTTNAPATFGFAQNAVASAGGLFSRLTDPAAVLPAAVGPTIRHEVVVTWNSKERPRRNYKLYSDVVSTIT